MLKKYSLRALQKAINHALALDPQIPYKISQLHGKVLEVIVAPLSVNFFIRFDEQKIQLLAHYEGSPDTTIHSSPLGLIRLSFLPASKARSLFNDNIRISGDMDLGQQVKKLFDEMDIDWEGHLAHFTGDVIAHQLGSLFRKGRDFTQHFHESMRLNMTEYLQEELRMFPSRRELEDFFNEIDELSLDVERLQAHIQKLMVEHEIN
ncbi:hypothetical protein FOG18_03400 [Legionella israelensis]|uniref:ubiquinone biosynthesis accessory factor UbiJ n=1 Tax=Legionella israelensis TaxID=454 RepID=UPI00117EC7B0|nr:SCP2 sterol-binding domain-containing protein [Legionella israelensis]QDP71682.1 hypothetical protein FOG18_03400 [Legionella israelensis]